MLVIPDVASRDEKSYLSRDISYCLSLEVPETPGQHIAALLFHKDQSSSSDIRELLPSDDEDSDRVNVSAGGLTSSLLSIAVVAWSASLSLISSSLS